MKKVNDRNTQTIKITPKSYIMLKHLQQMFLKQESISLTHGEIFEKSIMILLHAYQNGLIIEEKKKKEEDGE